MSGSRISNWYYVYVLQSKTDKGFYIGFTKNLKSRLKQHNTRKNFSTKTRIPLQYVYVEACLSKYDAKRRERYLKTTQGGRFLKLRLKEFIRNVEK